MDYRHGKCSGCGAGFNIPASFQHDTAKCKECGGVVNIGPVLGALAAPAARVSEPAAPAPSALERLKAERAKALSDGAASRPPQPAGVERPAKRMQGPSKAASGGVRSAHPSSGSKAVPREASTARPPAPKSRKHSLVIAAVLLIAGITAAYFFFSEKDGPAKAAEDAPAQEPPK